MFFSSFNSTSSEIGILVHSLDESAYYSVTCVLQWSLMFCYFSFNFVLNCVSQFPLGETHCHSQFLICFLSRTLLLLRFLSLLQRHCSSEPVLLCCEVKSTRQVLHTAIFHQNKNKSGKHHCSDSVITYVSISTLAQWWLITSQMNDM